MTSPTAWAVRLSVFFGALFLIHGVHLTYLPVWLDGRGLSPTEIALATSAPMLVRLVLTPSLAFAADRAGVHREMIIAACATALALMLAMNGAWPIPVIIGLVILMQIALQTIMPLADAVTMSAVKAHALDYGRIRLWGSVTFILAGYAAGFSVERFGLEAVLALSMTGAALVTIASLMLPRPAAAGARASKLTLAEAMALVRDPPFLLFLAVCGVIQGSHAVLYVFGVLHWRAQGLSAGYIATLWAIAVLAEIALFWASRWVVGFGALRLMMLGGASGLVRWLAMALDPAPAMLLPLQILHAGTFAATHLGAMHWIAARVPAAAAGTAQALLSTTTAGLGMGGAMLLSGPLYASLAGRAYLAMVALSAVGIGLALALARHEARGAPHTS